MTSSRSKKAEPVDIRKKAEDLVANEQEPALDGMSGEDVRRLIHELRVHQIELEMQNDELRRTQDELEASRSRYFDLFDLAPVGYFTLGRSGLIMEANFTLSSLLGIHRHQLVGTVFTHYIVPEDQDLYYLHHKQVIEKGLHQGFELRLRRVEGGSFWVQLEARLMWDPEGQPMFRAVVSDISERKRVEKELVNAHGRLEALWSLSSFEETPGRSIEDHVLASITKMTESAFGFFGYVNEEQTVLLRTVFSGDAMNVCSTVERPTCFEIASSGVWTEAVRKRQPLILNSYSEPHPAKKGLPVGHVPIRNLMVVPCLIHGKVTSVAAVANKPTDFSQEDVQQITAFLLGIDAFIERKRLARERERLHVQSLQNQKVESLGRMAGAVAHHYNNQLQVVIGNLELATFANVTPLESAACLKKATQAARRAAELGAQMRTYLGQTAGGQEPLDIVETCEQAMAFLRAGLPKDVALQTEYLVPRAEVKANASQIHQIVTQVVTNAWESMNGGSGNIQLTIGIAAGTDIPVEHRFPGDWHPVDQPYVCLEVVDSGTGISPTDLDRIFDPFFSSKFTGRGMGLPVVLGLMRAHHGGIVVTSEMARGSAFRLYFPLAKMASLQTVKSADAAPVEWNGTMLVIEDEVMVLEMIVTMLKLLNIPVLQAHDGVEGMEVLKRSGAEIRGVICDLTMPRMNGWETIKAIREIDPKLPIILASGHDEEHAVLNGHDEKPQVFLRKPFSFQRLCDAIKKITPR